MREVVLYDAGKLGGALATDPDWCFAEKTAAMVHGVMSSIQMSSLIAMVLLTPAVLLGGLSRTL